jgi:hypothetical protein
VLPALLGSPHIAHEENYDNNVTKAYTFFSGRFAKGMNHKIESNLDFKSSIKNNLFKLLAQTLSGPKNLYNCQTNHYIKTITSLSLVLSIVEQVHHLTYLEGMPQGPKIPNQTNQAL